MYREVFESLYDIQNVPFPKNVRNTCRPELTAKSLVDLATSQWYWRTGKDRGGGHVRVSHWQMFPRLLTGESWCWSDLGPALAQLRNGTRHPWLVGYLFDWSFEHFVTPHPHYQWSVIRTHTSDRRFCEFLVRRNVVDDCWGDVIPARNLFTGTACMSCGADTSLQLCTRGIQCMSCGFLYSLYNLDQRFEYGKLVRTYREMWHTFTFRNKAAEASIVAKSGGRRIAFD